MTMQVSLWVRLLLWALFGFRLSADGLEELLDRQTMAKSKLYNGSIREDMSASGGQRH